MSDLFKNYLNSYSVGLKSFNSTMASKPTQLRSERTKQLYDFFHTSVLPAINTVNPKIYKQIIKSLSITCRNKDVDLEDVISQIRPLLTGTNVIVETPSQSPLKNPEFPPSPSHKATEQKKKKILKKKTCLKPIKQELTSESDASEAE